MITALFHGSTSTLDLFVQAVLQFNFSFFPSGLLLAIRHTKLVINEHQKLKESTCLRCLPWHVVILTAGKKVTKVLLQSCVTIRPSLLFCYATWCVASSIAAWHVWETKMQVCCVSKNCHARQSLQWTRKTTAGLRSQGMALIGISYENGSRNLNLLVFVRIGGRHMKIQPVYFGSSVCLVKSFHTRCLTFFLHIVLSMFVQKKRKKTTFSSVWRTPPVLCR